jgi:Tfp pilus assembly protein PilO
MVFVKEKQQIVILVVAAAMVAAFVLGRYLPLLAKKKAALRQLKQQSAVIEKGESDRRILPGLTEKLAHDTSAIANYDAQVPPQRQLEFLKALDAMMTEFKLAETLIQPGQQKEAAGLGVVPLDIRCKGTLDQLFRFYTAFQRMPRAIRIEKINLANDRNYEGMVTMNTKAAIYYGRPDTKR